MDLQTVFVGQAAHGLQIFQGKNGAAPTVMSVLHADERCPRDMDGRLPDVVSHIDGIHDPPV